MLNPKWIGLIVFVWITLTFLGGTFEKHTTATGDWEGDTQETQLEYLMNVKNIVAQTSGVGEVNFVLYNEEYWDSLWQMITWDFTFLRGEGYEMIRWIVFLPVAGAIAYGLAYAFVQLMQGFIPFT